MAKLIALYRNPADPEEFDRHFFNVHVPLVRNFPGLRNLNITRITGAPIGEDGAPAGKAVTRDILGFAADVITVFHGEVA
jgi:hypothetical protein